MSLATKCPHCRTTFKVAVDQLKLQSGLVRCGICQQVFNGIEHLIASNDATVPPLASVDTSFPNIELETPENNFADIHTADTHNDTHTNTHVNLSDIDFDETLINLGQDAHDDLTRHSTEEAFTSESNANSFEFDTTTPIDTVILNKSILENAQEEKNEENSESVITTPVENREEDEEPEETDYIEKLSFIRQAKTKRRLFWFFLIGTLLLLILLIGQTTYQFRNLIAAIYPPSKEALITLCQYVQCQIQLQAQLDELSYEADELHSLHRENTFEFSLLMRNHSNLVQAWPYIELTLKNIQKQPVLKRVFTPTDYLTNSQTVQNGFPANQEQAIKLYFELNQIKASDYEVTFFYP